MPMSDMSSFVAAAALIADPARGLILTALLDGRALPAGELTARGHHRPDRELAPRQAARQRAARGRDRGRHRYYRLAGGHVAEALERLSGIHAAGPVRRRALGRQGRELRFCRCCYDHLAGQVGVAATSARPARRGYLEPAPEKRFAVTPAGQAWFAGIGLDVDAIRPTRRGLARQCLDWTERSHHLAGPLGVELLHVLCARGWLRHRPASRAVEVTPRGRAELQQHLGVGGIVAAGSKGWGAVIAREPQRHGRA